MEAASEKPRRGRPPSIPPELVDAARQLVPHVTTTRQLHEHVYAFMAYERLHADPELAPLFERDRVPVSLLAELGRLGLEDAGLAREAAAQISAQRLSTTRARAVVRRLRLGQDATVNGFAHALAVAADAYIRRHGRPSRGDAVAALGQLYAALVDDEP